MQIDAISMYLLYLYLLHKLLITLENYFKYIAKKKKKMMYMNNAQSILHNYSNDYYVSTFFRVFSSTTRTNFYYNTNAHFTYLAPVRNPNIIYINVRPCSVGAYNTL